MSHCKYLLCTNTVMYVSTFFSKVNVFNIKLLYRIYNISENEVLVLIFYNGKNNIVPTPNNF